MYIPRLMLAAVAVPLFSLAAAPGITSITITPKPAVVGASVQFVGVGTASGGGTLTYRWFFGDTLTSGAPSALNATFNHVYAAPGHYTVTFEVTETGGGSPGVTTDTRTLTVTHPLTNPKPTNSSTIILDSTNTNIWVVNPDQDTVTCLDIAPATPVILAERSVGQAPRTLAQCSVDGRVWVVSQQHPSVSIFHPTTFVLEHVIPLPHGSLPYGIAMSPDGLFAYVTLQGSGGVRKIDTATRKIVKSTGTPASARGVSVKSNGNLLVTRFISPQSDPLLQYNDPAFIADNHGEVVELNSNLGVVRTFELAMDPGPFPLDADPDFGPSGAPPAASGSRGIPNYLTSLVITPDGRRAWVPSKKDNVQRGSEATKRDGKTPGPEVTYRAILSSLDLAANTEQITERLDIDNSEMPQAACMSPLGDYIFIALQGTNRIQVRDAFNMSLTMNSTGDLTGVGATDGLAPQGIVFDPSTNRIYVQNYMSRTISKMDATAIINSNGAAANLGAPTVVTTIQNDPEKLGTTVLKGKQIFYNSGDPKMSLNGYISCAGCHLDGGSDARVFDFTNRGEGFRNTVMLQGRGNGSGMKHGNVHWSANFNEIQDFVNDIVNAFGGTGFTPGVNAPMGTANGGTADIDAMAAYVHSLTKVSRSPFRKADGTLSISGAAGEAIFKAMDCQSCHGGREFSDSTIFTLAPPAVGPAVHNIGTVKPTSGKRLNGVALPGVDTPTLKGVWQTAPYLHDGSAATLEDVFADPAVAVHFVSSTAQRKQLAQYMREIDEIDAPPAPSSQVNNVTIASVSTGRPYSLGTAEAGALAFVDRSYTITGGTLANAANLLVRTAEDDKRVTTANHLRLTFGAGATWTVYVCYDPRAGSAPDWFMNNFAASAETVAIANVPGNLMVRQLAGVTATTLTFGGNLATGAAGALRNYIVLLQKTGGTEFWEEGPLNKAEWVHDQDADGDGLLDEFEAVTASVLTGLSPWNDDSVTLNTADEDKTIGPDTLFVLQGGGSGGGGGGGGGGGCGLSGLEFLLPLALVRIVRRRRA